MVWDVYTCRQIKFASSRARKFVKNVDECNIPPIAVTKMSNMFRTFFALSESKWFKSSDGWIVHICSINLQNARKGKSNPTHNVRDIVTVRLQIIMLDRYSEIIKPTPIFLTTLWEGQHMTAPNILKQERSSGNLYLRTYRSHEIVSDGRLWWSLVIYMKGIVYTGGIAFPYLLAEFGKCPLGNKALMDFAQRIRSFSNVSFPLLD